MHKCYKVISGKPIRGDLEERSTAIPQGYRTDSSGLKWGNKHTQLMWAIISVRKRTAMRTTSMGSLPALRNVAISLAGSPMMIKSSKRRRAASCMSGMVTAGAMKVGLAAREELGKRRFRVGRSGIINNPDAVTAAEY